MNRFVYRSDDILFQRHTAHAWQSLLLLIRGVLVFSSLGGVVPEVHIYHSELDGGLQSCLKHLFASKRQNDLGVCQSLALP